MDIALSGLTLCVLKIRCKYNVLFEMFQNGYFLRMFNSMRIG